MNADENVAAVKELVSSQTMIKEKGTILAPRNVQNWK